MTEKQLRDTLNYLNVIEKAYVKNGRANEVIKRYDAIYMVLIDMNIAGAISNKKFTTLSTMLFDSSKLYWDYFLNKRK